MLVSKRPFLAPLALSAVLALSSCGGDDEPASTDLPTTETDPAATANDDDGTSSDEAEDHDDEDHDDAADDHDDEDPDADHDDDEDDHDDEDHDDEDHDDEDHDDEDHDDEDHDDEDHDDEDHDDEDHDDENDEGDHDHEDGSAGLGAHEHGTAEMTIAALDGDVAIDLISPTFNVFGFEYEPTTDDDLAIESDRTAALTAAGTVTVNSEADCELTTPVTTEVERDGSHSEITVSWRFSCEHPDEVDTVDASGLFDEFPNFEDVDVEWVSESEQSSAELSATEATVTLQR